MFPGLTRNVLRLVVGVNTFAVKVLLSLLNDRFEFLDRNVSHGVELSVHFVDVLAG